MSDTTQTKQEEEIKTELSGSNQLVDNQNEMSFDQLIQSLSNELTYTGVPESVIREALCKIISPEYVPISLPDIKTRDKVIILGFAPSSKELAPIDDDSFDLWPLNEIYMDMPRLESRATAWFQLHGYEPPTCRDANQTQHLATLRCPVIMWRKHPQIPNSIQYPLPQILKEFDIYGEGMLPEATEVRARSYFTNSISWMIALAILLNYKEIHVYGVDMAQSQEFEHQKPSVEFFLGWARGRGIKLYLPTQCDLLKSYILYGFDDANPWRVWLDGRHQELTRRREEVIAEFRGVDARRSHLSAVDNQLTGAQQDVEYFIRNGPLPLGSLLKKETKDGASNVD